MKINVLRFVFGAFSLFASSTAIAQPEHVDARFEAMKHRVGIWRSADSPTSPLRIEFSLTAGGTVLLEHWTRDGQPHSMTLYHQDGDQLIATHYCPQGNQPRLATLPQADGDVVRFAFKDATDLDEANESYAVALAFDLSDEQTLIRSETYRSGGVDEASELRLVRDE